MSDTDKLTEDELAELASKDVDAMSGPELHTYGTQALGLDIPDSVKEKAALHYIVLQALRSPAEASGVQGEPDASHEEVEDLGDGREAAHRPVSDVNAAGDWRDPFSGLMVWHGQHVNPENGAQAQATGDRRRRKDPVGQVYVPVAPGDDVVLIRELIDED